MIVLGRKKRFVRLRPFNACLNIGGFRLEFVSCSFPWCTSALVCCLNFSALPQEENWNSMHRFCQFFQQVHKITRMNIPLTQRLLLTALKHVCDCLKYREPKWMAGDMKTWSPSRQFFSHSKREKLCRGLAPVPAGDSVVGLSLPGGFWCLRTLLGSKPRVSLVQQEFDLFSLRDFRRTCNSEFLRWRRCRQHPNVINVTKWEDHRITESQSLGSKGA